MKGDVCSWRILGYKTDERTSQSSFDKRREVSSEKGLPENKCQNSEHGLNPGPEKYSVKALAVPPQEEVQEGDGTGDLVEPTPAAAFCVSVKIMVVKHGARLGILVDLLYV